MSISSWNLSHPYLDTSLDEAQPWALPLILRMERGVEVTHEDAVIAAARGVALLLADERTNPEREWYEPLNRWMHGRIRKVARRARASKWDAVCNLPGITSEFGTAQVRVLLPHPAEVPPREVSALQVSGLDLPRMDVPTQPEGEFDLYIALTPEASMSTGKSMAQAGHIAHLAVLQQDEMTLQDWESSGLGVYLAHWNDAAWAVQVQDAGFTEVAPGTLTAKGDFYR